MRGTGDERADFVGKVPPGSIMFGEKGKRTTAVSKFLQAAGIDGKEKLGTKQAPLNNMDHLMKVQAFIVCSGFLQKIRIEVGNAIIVATLKFAELGNADRSESGRGNTIT